MGGANLPILRPQFPILKLHSTVSCTEGTYQIVEPLGSSLHDAKDAWQR
jgi:hypothetical protein